MLARRLWYTSNGNHVTLRSWKATTFARCSDRDTPGFRLSAAILRTYLAFSAGEPTAISAANVAKNVFEAEGSGFGSSRRSPCARRNLTRSAASKPVRGLLPSAQPAPAHVRRRNAGGRCWKM